MTDDTVTRYRIWIRCRAGTTELRSGPGYMRWEDMYHNVWAETAESLDEALDLMATKYNPSRSKEISRVWYEEVTR